MPPPVPAPVPATASSGIANGQPLAGKPSSSAFNPKQSA
jgi:hypothetical protein